MHPSPAWRSNAARLHLHGASGPTGVKFPASMANF